MSDSFYKDGLSFECTQCSACCRFDPGFVFLSLNDVIRLSEYKKLSKDLFIQKFCRIVSMGENKRLSLKEEKNFDCIFWSNGGCEVYEARPLQCRSYPFGRPFLVSSEAWNREAENCPGMNKGEIHSKKVIDEWLKKRDNELYLLGDIL